MEVYKDQFKPWEPGPLWSLMKELHEQGIAVTHPIVSKRVVKSTKIVNFTLTKLMIDQRPRKNAP